MSTIAVSSFSLNSRLGPLRLSQRDEHGVSQPLVVPRPAEETLEQFAATVASRFGIGAVELCQIQFDASDDERIAALRASLDASGVRVLTVPIDAGDLSGDDPAHRAEDVAEIERWLDIAQALGAEYARVNTGTPHAAGVDADRSGLVSALRHLADSARSRGLRLLVENHGGSSSDPEYLLALREEVGPEHLGILLDLGNFEPVNQISHARFMEQEVDDLAIDAEPVYERIARLAPVAELVHAKAYDPRSDGTPLLDLDRALAIVAESGYAGHVTIEWEGVDGDPWQRTGETIEAVRKVFPGLR